MPARFAYWLQEPWKRLGAALVLGSVAVLGFAPYDFPLATLLSLVGLWGLWSNASSWRQGAKEGFAFGLGMFGFGVSWLGVSLGLYGGVPFGITWLVVCLFVALLASFIAVVGAVAVWSKQIMPMLVWALLLLPTFWVISEWLRVVLWDGFPWLLIGYSHSDTWLAGWAPIVGTLGVSYAVALSAGLVWWMIRFKQWMPAALSYGLFWGVSGQLGAIQWVSAIGQPTPIALVHGQVSETTKWNSQALVPILHQYQQASLPMLGQVKAVVWPETAIPTFLDSAMPVLAAFNAQAIAQGTHVITGVAIRETTLAGRQYYNSIAGLDGTLRYDKRHLVPFSEYYPGFSILSALARLMNMPMAQFSVGETPKVQSLAGHAVALGVCYEADFGYEMMQVTPQADWWLIVSDDGWFHPSAMAAQHWQMTKLRARELGREVVRVTNQGYSGIAHVDGSGLVVATPVDPLAAHLVQVQAYEGNTPYVRFHDMPLLGLLSVVLAMLVMRWRHLSRQV